MEKTFDEPGSILLYNKITQEEADLFLKILARGKFSYVSILKEVFGDNLTMLELFDVMAGSRVQFPERRKIYKTLEKVYIYTYCEHHNFSDESYKFIAKQYNKRAPQVRSIVETMRKYLSASSKDEITKELDEAMDEDFD